MVRRGPPRARRLSRTRKRTTYGYRRLTIAQVVEAANEAAGNTWLKTSSSTDELLDWLRWSNRGPIEYDHEVRYAKEHGDPPPPKPNRHELLDEIAMLVEPERNGVKRKRNAKWQQAYSKQYVIAERNGAVKKKTSKKKLSKRRNAAALSITKIKLDRGGYDSSGGYWGVGKPLWSIDTGYAEIKVRAASKTAAIVAGHKEASDKSKRLRGINENQASDFESLASALEARLPRPPRPKKSKKAARVSKNPGRSLRITDQQIRTMRKQASAQGDHTTARLCDMVLDHGSSHDNRELVRRTLARKLYDTKAPTAKRNDARVAKLLDKIMAQRADMKARGARSLPPLPKSRDVDSLEEHETYLDNLDATYLRGHRRNTATTSKRRNLGSFMNARSKVWGD